MCLTSQQPTPTRPRRGARSRPNMHTEVLRVIQWAMDERNPAAVTPKQIAQYANACPATARRWRNGSPVGLDSAAAVAACEYAPVDLRESLRQILSPAPADAKTVAD